MKTIRYNPRMGFGITSQQQGEDVHYRVSWSPLARADRWEINAKVPSVAGVYEIYWMDGQRRLRMLALGQTRYGGLRSELRRLTDPELTVSAAARNILSDKAIWYRYAPCGSADAMADVIWFFRTVYFPENPGVEHSGRYRMIYVSETAPNKLVWVH